MFCSMPQTSSFAPFISYSTRSYKRCLLRRATWLSQHQCVFCHKVLVPLMSLAEASEARKARLVALRRRKAGEESNAYALQMFQI